jgi:DNA-directed RNA polymerase subunit omega
MMIEPAVEEIIAKTGGRFKLVVLASRRARQINNYYSQLGGGIGHYVPPQVHSLSHKPLTIALEEIAAGKLTIATGDSSADGDSEAGPDEVGGE